MLVVQPVPCTTPDGVERVLRFTLGARKRISKRFGGNLMSAIKENGDECVPFVLHALMFDAKGNPPADLTVEMLEEQLSPDSLPELLALILSAATQGRQSKNDLEVLLKEAMENEIQEKLTGSPSGASVLSASDLQIASSGGSIPNQKSSHGSNGTKTNSESLTIALASSQPRSTTATPTGRKARQ